MDKNVLWYMEKQVERTLDNLKKHNMIGYFVQDEIELKTLLDQLIEDNSVIGVGDSMTLFETGTIEYFRERNLMFLDKYRKGITKEEKRDIYIKNFSADTFVCSTNALTQEGELYNIDGNGSRVAPMIYGPKQVIIIAGINKIVKNITEAEARVRNYAAPLDAKRLGKKTPCTELGYCIDCKSPERICNDFTIIRGQFDKERIKVIIVGKQLGY